MIGVALFAVTVYANPGFFGSFAQTSTATSSPAFLVRNTTIATTTSPVYDSYEVNGTNQTNTGNNNLPYAASLEVQFIASSTTSNLQWYYEYSDGFGGVNCVSNPNGCDWYSDDIFYTGASTTPLNNVTPTNSYSWTFASSTIGGTAQAVDNNRSNKVFVVPTPLRYVRTVFFCPSSQNCAVWARFVPKKEINN